MEKEKKTLHLPRRDFLKGAGGAVAGLALAGGVGGLLLSGCGGNAPVAAVSPPAWPAQYKKLDPDVAAEKGYKYYKEGG